MYATEPPAEITDPLATGPLDTVIASAIVIRRKRLLWWLGLLLTGGCVPLDPPEGTPASRSAVSAASVVVPKWRPRPTTHTRSTSASAPASAANQSESAASEDQLLTSSLVENFDRESIGNDWAMTSDHWRLEAGQLCGQSARNHPIWLKRRIPRNARISFRARAKSPEADLKVEAWGSGRGHAKGASYDDATSYVFIFGGWKNQLHVLARLNEHATDRVELRLDPTSKDARAKPVAPNTDYSFGIERRDGRTIVWTVNGVELFRYEDKAPLGGASHDHFAFNNWESPACFDDLTIVPLPE